METIASIFRKLFTNIKFFASNNEEEVDENEDVPVFLSTSVKRRTEDNAHEEMIKKRKKLIAPLSSKNDVDFCFSSYLGRSSISDYQKENLQMASDSLNMNQILRKRQNSPRVKSPDVYSIDDDDCDLHKRYDIVLPSGMTLRDRNCHTSPEKSSDEDCMIVGETHRTYSRASRSKPKLVLPTKRKEDGQTILMHMFSRNCSISRKSTPLTNSTLHNTKLNSSVPNDTKTRSITRSRSLNYPALSPMAKSFNPTVNLGESAFDKTLNNVIDLTNEDDEEQRQTIESRVRSSFDYKNQKSTFIAPDGMLDEDLLPSMVVKYDKKINGMQKKVEELKNVLSLRKEEYHQSLADILDKRMVLKEHIAEEQDAHKPSMEIAPITPEMVDEINRILTTRKTPLVQIKDTSVKLQDIRTLENTSWLNDEIINAYMNLIKLRSEETPKKYPKVHCFNTFLYEQLSKKGYMSVRRWTRKVDVFDFEILIIPIHLGNHWCLTQIRFREKTIFYYDSMGSPNNRCLNTMLQYLVEEYKDKKQGVFDTSNWILKNVPYEELPQQKNAYDCGVFACTFAEHVTRNSPLNFDQSHMQYFRYKMMYEILTGKLLL